MAIEIALDTSLKVAEIVSVLVGGGLVAYRLGRATQRMEAIMDNQRENIDKLQTDVTELNRAMVQVALQKERLDRHAQQLDRLEAIVIPIPRLVP